MNTEKYLYYCIHLLIATPLVTTVGKALLKTFSQIQTFAICIILACGVYYLVCHVLKGIFDKLFLLRPTYVGTHAGLRPVPLFTFEINRGDTYENE